MWSESVLFTINVTINPLAGPLAGYVCTRLGRRFTMFFIATLFALFYLVMVAAVNVWMMFIGRFGTGLATGAVSIVANIYIAETAAAKYRGFLGAMFQVHAHQTIV